MGGVEKHSGNNMLETTVRPTLLHSDIPWEKPVNWQCSKHCMLKSHVQV